MRPPNIPPSWDLPEPSDEDGEGCALPRALAPPPFRPFRARLLMASRLERAAEDEVRERVLVATPLTSLSVSSVGSRLTNSFCSNWTTTYGRETEERTLRPRAWMSLTWIWPRDGPDGCIDEDAPLEWAGPEDGARECLAAEEPEEEDEPAEPGCLEF